LTVTISTQVLGKNNPVKKSFQYDHKKSSLALFEVFFATSYTIQTTEIITREVHIIKDKHLLIF